MAQTITHRPTNTNYNEDTSYEHRDHEHDAADYREERNSFSMGKEKYGGMNAGASIFGWIVAAGLTIILTGIVASIGGAFAATQGAATAEGVQTASIIGGGLFLLILAVAYYTGGYVAGRLSRFDGAKQGVGVWIAGIIVTILLALIGTIIGSQINFAQTFNAAGIPLNAGALTLTGFITSLLALGVTFLAAVSGGKVGERYHHKIDKTLRS